MWFLIYMLSRDNQYDCRFDYGCYGREWTHRWVLGFLLFSPSDRYCLNYIVRSRHWWWVLEELFSGRSVSSGQLQLVRYLWPSLPSWVTLLSITTPFSVRYTEFCLELVLVLPTLRPWLLVCILSQWKWHCSHEVASSQPWIGKRIDCAGIWFWFPYFQLRWHLRH